MSSQTRESLEAAVLQALAVREAGQVLALPWTLRGEGIELDFDRDERVHIKLLRVVCKDPAGQFAFVSQTAHWVDQDARLWELAGTIQDSGEEFVAGPPDAAAFSMQGARGVDGEEGLLLRWRGVRVPAAEDNELWVAVSVLLAEDEPVSRWRICVGRERERSGGVLLPVDEDSDQARLQVPGRSASIDRVDLPVLGMCGPVRPRQGETPLQAQRYARLMVPTTVQGATPFHGGNEPLLFWMLTNTRREYPHPTATHALQCACVYAGDPADTESFRWLLYLGSEDESGFYKKFRHEGLSTPAGDEGVYAWRHVYYPPFADHFENPDAPPATEFGNTFASPYPAVVGGFRAKTEAFWYDACSFYRRFVERSALVAERISANERLSSLKGPNPFFAFIVAPVREGLAGPTLYERFLDIALTQRRVLENPYVPVTPSFLHLQTYLQGGEGVRNPDFPVELSVDEGLGAMIRRAADLEMRVNPYTAPEFVTAGSGWEEFIPENAYWYTRDHEIMREGPLLLRDHGSPATAAFARELMNRALVQTVGFSGIYQDTMSGSGTHLAYDPPSPLAPTHIAHGGSYWTEGKRRVVEESRAGLWEYSRFSVNGRDPEAYMVSEGPEEFLTGLFDLTQDGYTWIHHHLLLAEEVLFGLSAPGMSPQARDMSVPFWNLVYNEWTSLGRQTILASNIGLETNADFHPGEGFPGMTAREWIDLYVFIYGSSFVVGAKILNSFDLAFDSPLVRLEGDEITVDERKDPERAGIVITDVLRELYAAQLESFAGQFLLGGRMLRPLQVDFAESGVADNPVAACRKTDPEHWLWTFPIPYYDFPAGVPAHTPGWQWGSLQFPVLEVLHSMWRSAEGVLGLLLVNWTSGEASWRSRFDPELYDLGATDTYAVRELELGEEPRALGTFSGEIEIRTEHGPVALGGDLFIGVMPPRSVRVFTFEAAE